MEQTGETVYDSARAVMRAREEAASLWRYRHLVAMLVRRDIVMRYKRSALGIGWSMLKPLGVMLVMGFIFKNILARGDELYVAYLFTGLIPWMFFAETTGNISRNLLWGGNLLKQVYAPKSAFVVAIGGTSLVNMLLSMVPMVLVLGIHGRWPTVHWASLPLAILCLFAAAVGFGMLICTVTTLFPDAGELYLVVLQSWMYATPIIWKPEMLPANLQSLLYYLNPLAPLLQFFRAGLYYQSWPEPGVVALSIAISLTLLTSGWLVFCHLSPKLTYRM